MIHLSSPLAAVGAALVFCLLACLPVQAQEGTGGDGGAGARDGQVSGPITPGPASGARDPRPDQVGRPAGEEPDAARFGEAAPPPALATDPEALCAALSAGAKVPPIWQRSALPGESWECFAERGFGPEEGGGSVFAILRGHVKARVDGLRLKLNLPVEGTGQKAQAAAEETLKAVFAALGRILPLSLRDAMADRVPFTRTVGGVAMDFRKEFGPVPRYNVIIDFAQPPAKRRPP